MLKGISPLISPHLLKILMEMGHGDRLVLGDGNFPSESCGRRVIRADGHGVPDLLEAILPLFPLDSYSDSPVALMSVVPGDPTKPELWKTYENIISRYHQSAHIDHIERFDFYRQAREAYAVVATGEKALYANIILQKGVVII